MQEPVGPSAARAAMKEWLAILGQTVTWLADQLEVAQPTASRWLSSSRPDEHLRECIAILSGGRVPKLLWRTPEENALVGRMKTIPLPSSAAAEV